MAPSSPIATLILVAMFTFGLISIALGAETTVTNPAMPLLMPSETIMPRLAPKDLPSTETVQATFSPTPEVTSEVNEPLSMMARTAPAGPSARTPIGKRNVEGSALNRRTAEQDKTGENLPHATAPRQAHDIQKPDPATSDAPLQIPSSQQEQANKKSDVMTAPAPERHTTLTPPTTLTALEPDLETATQHANLAILMSGIALTVATGAGVGVLRRRYDPSIGQRQSTPTAPDPEHHHGLNAVNSESITLADLAYITPSDLLASLRRQHTSILEPLPDNHHALTCVDGARDHNEDYACAFDLKTSADLALQCMVVADGCGGHPGGRNASYIASRYASESLVRDRDLPPVQMVKNAFDSASLALQRIGQAHFGPNDLRTTLVIVVASRENYHFGWIGDGGILLHRRDDIWESIMTPHKGEAQNILTASLGPTQSGQPSFSNAARQAGDRLYMGTDGIFDMVKPELFWAWFEQSIANGAAPQKCLDAQLDVCAKDDRFDDNLTVAYLATPTPAMPKDVAPSKGQGVVKTAYRYA